MIYGNCYIEMQKKPLSGSTVNYHFSFQTLSDQNMKMDYYAIFLFQRLNLIPTGYILFDRTHSFHGNLGDSPENLWKLSVYEKL